MSEKSCMLHSDTAKNKKIVLYSENRYGKDKQFKYRYFTKDKKINKAFFKMIEKQLKEGNYGISRKPEPTLWYSCGSSWFDRWTETNRKIAYESEDPMTFVSKKEIYSLVLNMERILVVDSFQKLKKFNSKYGIKTNDKEYILIVMNIMDQFNSLIRERVEDEDFNHNDFVVANLGTVDPNKKYGFIQWDKVMKDYDGIQFCPYLLKNINNGQGFIDYFWYFSVDASTGSVWRISAIKEAEYEGKFPTFRTYYDIKNAKEKLLGIICDSPIIKHKNQTKKTSKVKGTKLKSTRKKKH
jgi:hypothetical protein